MAGEPEPVDHREQREDQEDDEVRREEDESPLLPRATMPSSPGRPARACASGRAIVDTAGAPSTRDHCTALSPRRGERATTSIPLARDLLDAGDHLVGGLLRRPAVVDHAAHRLGPHVLVVEDRELVVLGEFERRRARVELRCAPPCGAVGLPELALRAASWSPGTSGRASLRRTAAGSRPAAGTRRTPSPASCSSRPRR